jgi:pimeloyl-ACP methyl ester carboxylesterase
VAVAYAIHGVGKGPAWLLLPALSTISSRQEWDPLLKAWRDRAPSAGGGAPLITVDWPGFGDSERPPLPYSAELLARFLVDFQRDCCPADCGLVAAGHAAGVALLAHQRFALGWREMVAVAPTWRGPLPTMASRPAAAFAPIRRLVEAPLVGPLLYRLNTSRAVLGLMGRRHVDVAGPGLSPEGLRRRQLISRQRGARFASAAFVTGGLDPFATGEAWLAAAAALPFPLTVVVATQSPPRSRREMERLGAQAGRVLTLPGRLGAHEEFGARLAEMLA